MTFMEWCELLSYVVTIVGLPLAIAVFIYEQRKDRQNDDEEVFQRLADEYTEFLKLALAHADLHLLRPATSAPQLTAEQNERKYVLIGILVGLFERAYLLVYDDHMSKQTARMWQTWDDYMREWCRREDFRTLMASHLNGEDPDFQHYIKRLAHEESQRTGTA
jgi:hypothetical protein